MLFLKQSTASQDFLLGPFLDSTDGVTPETGLTIGQSDVKVSKNGGAFASLSGTIAPGQGDGFWPISFNATDTDTVGRLQISCQVAGACPVFMEFTVVEETVYDALFAANADIRNAFGLANADLDDQLEKIWSVLGLKVNATDNLDGTYTLAFRNAADDADLHTVTYTPATGARVTP